MELHVLCRVVLTAWGYLQGAVCILILPRVPLEFEQAKICTIFILICTIFIFKCYIFQDTGRRRWRRAGWSPYWSQSQRESCSSSARSLIAVLKNYSRGGIKLCNFGFQPEALNRAFLDIFDELLVLQLLVWKKFFR